MNEAEDRRKPQRYKLRAHATLVTGDGNWPAHLLNLSVRGALIAITEPHKLTKGREMSIEIIIEEDQSLVMRGTVSHVKAHYVGLNCMPQEGKHEARLQELIEQFKRGQTPDIDY